MKFISALLLVAMTTGEADCHKLMRKGDASFVVMDDLYSFSEKENIKAEIAQAEIYMEQKRKEEAKEASQKKIQDAYDAIKKEKEDREKAEKDHVQSIMSLADKLGEDTDHV